MEGNLPKQEKPYPDVTLPAERVEITLLALIDAMWSRVVTGCADCDAIEATTKGQQENCERHQADMDRSSRYGEMLEWLANAAGVPEATDIWTVPR